MFSAPSTLGGFLARLSLGMLVTKQSLANSMHLTIVTILWSLVLLPDGVQTRTMQLSCMEFLSKVQPRFLR